MKNTNTIRTILFNILVILTILFIYLFFFPKKSYVNKVLDKELNPNVEETFKQNINNMKIAANLYFENSDSNKVTVKELINKNMIAELKDSQGQACSQESYIEKQNNSTKIYLECNDKTEEAVINEEQQESNEEKPKSVDKFLCIYQYEKRLEKSYTKWSEWSEWQEEKVESNNLTNVETKKINDETSSEGQEIEATKQLCPNNYKESENICMSKKPTNTIDAAKKYNCPNGYVLKSNMCYKENSRIQPTIKYSCPSDGERTHFELSNNKCNVYTKIKKQETYICPDGYNLSGNKCYKNESNNSNEKTLYRYQTRNEINEKIDIKWSTKNDNKLLNDGYTIVGTLSCEL